MKRFLASLVAASLAFASPASAKWEGPYRWCKCLLTGNYGPHCCKPVVSAPCYPCLNGCTNGECNGPTLDPHGVPDVFWTMVGDGEQCYLDLTRERSVVGGDCIGVYAWQCGPDGTCSDSEGFEWARLQCDPLPHEAFHGIAE